MRRTSITLGTIAGHGFAGPGDGRGVAEGLTEGLPGSPEVRAEVESIIGSALHFVLPGDTYAALELCRTAEHDFQVSTQKLQAMHDVGAAGPKDYAAYETLRQNVFTVEKNLARNVRASVFRLLGIAAMETVPVPTLAPAITARSPRNAGGWSGVRGLSGVGFGNPLVVAGIIAAIIALSLAAYFISEALDDRNARDVALLAEQARSLKEMYGSRSTYVRECTEGGGDRTTCAAEAAELYPEPHFNIPMPGSGYGWVPWAIGAAGVTLIAFFGYRVYSKERGQFRGLRGSVLPLRLSSSAGRARPKRRALHAPSRSKYALEVR